MAVTAVRGELCSGFGRGERPPDRGGAFGARRGGWESVGGWIDQITQPLKIGHSQNFQVNMSL